MNHSQPTQFDDDSLPPGPYSDAEIIDLEISGEPIRRRITAEEIAAVKRFWERQGRKPPPPYDKL